ncbi:probable cyclic nucleotide-gated ion channel 20, chloroplastic isoform X4 [Quercus lobata]|uniref:probable cyclic nucleotide-gated ion channel 20, chloroplastic isoform X4 n=1 Tax=Quercus lobata TaxID=97700 RepID=UPI0012473E26|nr:probable cyclic nucleotide-gated ion channel 20, chloroplastic isoform X4 [Quercus lobata]
MAGYENDDIPMLLDTHAQFLDEHPDSRFQRFVSTRSASISIPTNSMDSHDSETNLVGYTGPLRSERRTPFTQMSGPLYIGRKPESLFPVNQGVTGHKKVESVPEKFPSSRGKDRNDWLNDNYAAKNEHLLRSGQLGVCNDPYCTVCPTYDNFRAAQQKNSKASSVFDPKFRLAYVALESRVVGAGELVDHPKKIALNYICGYFFIDLFVVLPLPQIIILLILPKSLGGANYAKNLLRAAVLVQYIPRLYRFLPLLAGQSPSGFVFESAWANFIINLLIFMLSGHVVGSCWYLFGLQRVNQCLRVACENSGLASCLSFIDCGVGKISKHFSDDPNSTWNSWKDNVNASACLTEDGFSYGIYKTAVSLTMEHSIITKYIFSLFWGFQVAAVDCGFWWVDNSRLCWLGLVAVRLWVLEVHSSQLGTTVTGGRIVGLWRSMQISTLAGNQNPSYFVWEVLFTMAIIGLGLLLFALLIGNMQNFLQALGRRRLEMSLRRRDVEQWMSHRRLPEELRRQVRHAERYNWAATRGVNEEMLLENLPEDLQRDIRRHLCKFVKKVRIFALMDDPILDAICERLRQKIYIKGSRILYHGGLVEKMVFIVRGKAESKGEDGIVVPLSEGDVCGEELLTWCLEHSSISKDGRKIKIPGQRLLSNRTVTCLTNIEAFSLRAADLEEVTSLFARFLRNPRVNGAIRYESPYWRSLAAIRIQVAWRYRKKRLNRADTAHSNNSSRV